MRFANIAVAALSMGSAIAGTVKPAAEKRETNVAVLDDALELVVGIEQTIVGEVAEITDLLIDVVTGQVIPQIEDSLKDIAGELEDIKEFVEPLITEVVLPLVEAELELVVDILKETKDVVKSTLDYADYLLGTLTTELAKLVAAEIQFVLDTIEPAVTPIIEFAEAVISASPEDIDLIGTITTLKEELATLITDGVAPIEDALEILI